MKVLVMKCERSDFWYKNSVGKTFQIIKQDTSRYYVKQNKVTVPILKVDCEVIK
jgi:hypothetical protein